MCGCHSVGISHANRFENGIAHLSRALIEGRRCFINIRDIDRDENAVPNAIAIVSTNGKRVDVLRLIVQGFFGSDLTGIAVDAKCHAIHSPLLIGECIVICIRRSDRRADRYTGWSVLGNRADRASTVYEHGVGVLFDIRDVDRDKDRICGTAVIRNADSEIGVRTLRFIVERGFGLHLPCIRVNLKRVPIAPTQRIGQCIADIRICGSEGGTDVCASRCVLCDIARRTGTFGEHRGIVAISCVRRTKEY